MTSVAESAVLDGPHTGYRELAAREINGITVRLLWDPAGSGTVVVVRDAKLGERFEIRVRSDQRPLDVFYHPFAYAASRSMAGSTLSAHHPPGSSAADGSFVPTKGRRA